MAVPLKTFHTKFRGTFYDINGLEYRVYISTEEEVSSVKNIRLSATPFVVDCDADENYFKPVRTRTAKLTVIDEDGTLFDQIMPKDNFSTKVMVSLFRDNVLTGSTWFVSCETFEKPLSSRPSEVTFNLNGFLAMTELIKADPVYMNTSSLYGLLYSIGKGFNDAGISSWISAFWFPRTYYYNNIIDYSWYFETKKYKDVNGDRIEIVGKSVLSLIEAFCKFYGLVAIENRSGVVFVSDLASNNYYEYFLYYGQLPRVHPNGRDMIYNPIQWSDLTFMGTNHTLNTIRPAKSVSVVSKIDEYNNKLQLPSFASKAYHFGEILSKDSSKICHSLMSDMKNISGTLTMGNPRAFVVNIKKDLSSANSYYVNEYTITYNGESEMPYNTNASFLYIGPNNHPICKNWSRISAGSFHTHADELTNANVWCGAFMARAEVYGGQPKASYNLTDFLVVNGLCCSPINDLAATFPDEFAKMKAATLRSEKIVKIYNGFVNIQSSAMLIDYFGNFYDSGEFILNLQLKIGNQYYNGSEWTEDESFFLMSFEEGKIRNNKTENLQTTEENGFFIEIPKDQCLEGIVELSVSPLMLKGFNISDDKLPMCVMFSELSVNFTYKASDLAFGDKENHYFCMLDAGAKDEIEVENDIASDCYNKAAENVIKKPYSLDNASTENNIKPELLLLSRMKEYYSQKRNILSLEVCYVDTKYMNLYSVLWQDGKTYFPFGYSIDYKANKVDLKLFEQPTYPDDIIP